VLDKGFELGRNGKPIRLNSGSPKTVIQIWVTFLCSNIIPNSHVSRVTTDKALLLYCIIRGYMIDVADLITKEISRLLFL